MWQPEKARTSKVLHDGCGCRNEGYPRLGLRGLVKQTADHDVCQPVPQAGIQPVGREFFVTEWYPIS